jgi:ubiquinone/menaquinone biosynthesis C-methylase UbiE
MNLNFNFKDYHKIDLNDPIFAYLVKNPHEVGLDEEDLAGKTELQKALMIIGEYFAKISRYTGELVSNLLFQSQWGFKTPDWFDHRHHLLDPEKHFTDFWTASADNVIFVLPLNGKLLSLCSGDGFYEYYFFRKRAKEIVCIDSNPEVYRHAVRLHKAENIKYILGDVLDYEPEELYFDVVLIRGAIEHFSQESQQIIFKKALKALKIGGWFCGDTPANPNKDKYLLPAHQNEWDSEDEMRQELTKVFDFVKTYVLQSLERTTLFWKCKRTK